MYLLLFYIMQVMRVYSTHCLTTLLNTHTALRSHTALRARALSFSLCACALHLAGRLTVRTYDVAALLAALPVCLLNWRLHARVRYAAVAALLLLPLL